MRATTSTLGAFGIITAVSGVIRAAGAQIDARVIVIAALLILAALLAISAFVGPKAPEAADGDDVSADVHASAEADAASI
ncbi:hypothetical protein [Trueperella bialowiezensis]|uniref:Uncharacterized protein n=1 Tax=Trueperella bialowiezensis TaxID=312285 RepID=A0A3S4V9D9_9ACTO|nr:hypothetical protein [Trueperella bialowiezensis]VEI12495.1 Uncharacterised protein [Trueperella bialowiezensis]